MLTVSYDPNDPLGAVIRDGQLDDYVALFFDKTVDNIVSVSSELIIYAFRAAVAKGDIDHKKIQFEFKGEILPVDKNGRIEHWPAGFSDNLDDYLTVLAGWGE